MVRYALDCRNCRRVYYLNFKCDEKNKFDGALVNRCDICGGKEFKKVEILYVDTANPRADIWNIIDYYTVKKNARNLIKRRIERDFFEYNKNLLNLNIKSKLGSKEVRRFIEINDAKEALERFLNNVVYARELFESSFNVPLSTKPMLVYYGARALAEAIISITFKDKPEMHGFNIDIKSKKIKFYPGKNNVSALLYNSLTPSTKYIKYPSMDFSIDDVIYSFCRRSMMSKYYDWVYKKEYKILCMPNILLLLMILYYFSISSRYRPLEWRKTINGDDSKAYLKKIILKYASAHFPELFVNCIDDRYYRFLRITYYEDTEPEGIKGLDL